MVRLAPRGGVCRVTAMVDGNCKRVTSHRQIRVSQSCPAVGDTGASPHEGMSAFPRMIWAAYARWMLRRALPLGVAAAFAMAFVGSGSAEAQTTSCPSIELSVFGSSTPARALQTHNVPQTVHGLPRCMLADRFARYYASRLNGTRSATVWRVNGRTWKVSHFSADNSYTHVNARRGSYSITFQF
jgi:hypothetical protein